MILASFSFMNYKTKGKELYSGAVVVQASSQADALLHSVKQRIKAFSTSNPQTRSSTLPMTAALIKVSVCVVLDNSEWISFTSSAVQKSHQNFSATHTATAYSRQGCL